MMRHSALARLLAVALLLFGSLAACHKKIPEPKDPAQLYNEGLSYMSKVGKLGFISPPDYEKARSRFQRIMYDYPTSRYAPLAEMRVADTYYEAGDYDLAATAYDAWRKNHVGRPEQPYVAYRIAMSYYHQILSTDRDQTTTRMALNEFQNLLSAYPNSEYAGAVGDKTEILKTRLAKHEFYVGKFYFRHKDYWAAVDRFQGILANFSRKGLDEGSMYWIWRSYVQLGRSTEAQQAFNKLNEKYPDSALTKRARLLKREKSAKGAKQWLGP